MNLDTVSVIKITNKDSTEEFTRFSDRFWIRTSDGELINNHKIKKFNRKNTITQFWDKDCERWITFK